MINLGFTTAGLFFLAGFLYSRRQSTHLSAFGGLARQIPLLATFLLIIGLASIGLPGTNGFVGEFLILLGAFQASWVYGSIAVLGVILSAAYFLWYYERAMFGPLTKGLSQVMARTSPCSRKRSCASTPPDSRERCREARSSSSSGAAGKAMRASSRT